MLFIRSKIGKDYEVYDSGIGLKKIMGYYDIKKLVDNGEHIKGVAYIDNDLTINPVAPLYSLDKIQMARNKMIVGTLTGIAGFDLLVEGSNVIALPLSDDFLTYIDKYAEDEKFVLSLPDCITSISSRFLDCFYGTDKDYRLYVDLPSSLSIIDESGLSFFSYDPILAGVRFNGVVDRLVGDLTNSTIAIHANSKDYTFNVRHLEAISIDLSCKLDSSIEDINIYLPDTEVLESTSIRGSRYNVFLGNSIRELGVFSSEVFETISVSSDELMEKSNIVYIPDTCYLEKIDFVVAEPYDNVVYAPYIVVLSRDMYNSLMKRYEDGLLEVLTNKNVRSFMSYCNFQTWIGLLIYDTEDELEGLKINLRRYVNDYKKYFSNWFDDHNFGHITHLNLRK